MANPKIDPKITEDEKQAKIKQVLPQVIAYILDNQDRIKTIEFGQKRLDYTEVDDMWPSYDVIGESEVSFTFG